VSLMPVFPQAPLVFRFPKKIHTFETMSNK
jgi:hypothetical protein